MSATKSHVVFSYKNYKKEQNTNYAVVFPTVKV
jgi:hypothetical protein